MTDELESARFDMLLGGLESENILRLAQAKSDLYNQSEVAKEARMEAYHGLISLITPYIDFSTGDEEAEEQMALSEEEERRKFLEQFRQIDWKEVSERLPRKPSGK